MTLSIFNNIPGMGKKRIKKLWEQFESLEDIKASSTDQISLKCGFSKELSEQIKKRIT